eukprot:gene11058-18665_t
MPSGHSDFIVLGTHLIPLIAPQYVKRPRTYPPQFLSSQRLSTTYPLISSQVKQTVTHQLKRWGNVGRYNRSGHSPSPRIRQDREGTMLSRTCLHPVSQRQVTTTVRPPSVSASDTHRRHRRAPCGHAPRHPVQFNRQGTHRPPAGQRTGHAPAEAAAERGERREREKHSGHSPAARRAAGHSRVHASRKAKKKPTGKPQGNAPG